MSLAVHINSLPDLVLRRIFSKVPFTDLLHTGNVCPLWKYYQVETGKQVRSLALLIGSSSAQSLIANSCFTLKYRDLLLNDDGSRMYSSQYLGKFFHLNYDSFSSDQSTQLLNIFPHITTLEIAIKDVPIPVLLLLIVFNPLLILLQKWSPVLKSLKIYLQFELSRVELKPFYNAIKLNFANLLNVINSMQSLEHFTFVSYMNLSLPDSIDLPILGQLREFYFHSPSSHHEILYESLQRYAVPNDNLQQIGLFSYDIATFSQRFPQLANKKVYLSLCLESFYSTHSFDSLKPFSSITAIFMRTSGVNFFYGALNLLSSLRQLKFLYLQIKDFQNCQAQTQVSRDRLAQLSSVRVLKIITTLKESTSELESNHWAYLFPNVQVIELTLITYRKSSIDGADLHFSKDELQKSLTTFLPCLKLHHIYTKTSISATEYDNSEWIVQKVSDQKMIINSVSQRFLKTGF